MSRRRSFLLIAALSLLAPSQVNATAAAQPSTTCVTREASPSPTAFHCGIQGTLRHPALISQTLIPSSDSAPVLTCGKSCLGYSGNEKCISFAYNGNNHDCRLFSQTLNAQGIQNGGSNSLNFLYNRHCFKTICTSISCTPGGTQPSFLLRASGSGTTDDGRYALLSNTGDTDFVTFAPSKNAATPFTFDDQCRLVGYNEEIANIDSGATMETLYFNTQQQIDAGDAEGNPFVTAKCDIVDGFLECAAQNDTIFYACSDQLQLQIAEALRDGCSRLRLKPIYV